MSVPVFAFWLIRLGTRDDRARHRRIARIAWPIWIYVSITGVLIYLLLYPRSIPRRTSPDPPSAERSLVQRIVAEGIRTRPSGADLHWSCFPALAPLGTDATRYDAAVSFRPPGESTGSRTFALTGMRISRCSIRGDAIFGPTRSFRRPRRTWAIDAFSGVTRGNGSRAGSPPIRQALWARQVRFFAVESSRSVGTTRVEKVGRDSIAPESARLGRRLRLGQVSIPARPVEQDRSPVRERGKTLFAKLGSSRHKTLRSARHSRSRR